MVLQRYPSANHGARWVKTHSHGRCSIIDRSLCRAITMQTKRSRTSSKTGLTRREASNWITRCGRSACVELPRISTPAVVPKKAPGTHDLQPYYNHANTMYVARPRNDRKNHHHASRHAFPIHLPHLDQTHMIAYRIHGGASGAPQRPICTQSRLLSGPRL
jgi:hypothetical protein